MHDNGAAAHHARRSIMTAPIIATIDRTKSIMSMLMLSVNRYMNRLGKSLADVPSLKNQRFRMASRETRGVRGNCETPFLFC